MGILNLLTKRGQTGATLVRSATELERRDSVDSRSRLPPLDTPGCFGRRNCNVNLDDLRWDRPELDCEPQQARGIRRNVQLDETVVMMMGRLRRCMGTVWWQWMG